MQGLGVRTKDVRERKKYSRKCQKPGLGAETGFSLAVCLSRRTRIEDVIPKPLTQRPPTHTHTPWELPFLPLSDITSLKSFTQGCFLLPAIIPSKGHASDGDLNLLCLLHHAPVTYPSPAQGLGSEL